MIQTLDVTAKEWFDRINGNSYFSAQITVNFGLTDQQTLHIPFQYGYGDSYEYAAMEVLKYVKLIDCPDRMETLWRYCRDNNIILRTNKIEKCLKREVLAFSK
jgi:hypothetical protein